MDWPKIIEFYYENFKTKLIEDITHLYQLGQRDFAENYVQELLEKKTQAAKIGLNDIRWHFIGHLQTNKVKSVVKEIDSLHTLDSEKLAKEIQKQLLKINKTLDCFIEINIDEEPTKAGILASKLPEFLSFIQISCKQIKIIGLMCIPDPKKDSRAAFKEIKTLSQKYSIPFLSMGMSADYKTAIEEGSTHIRIGTLLFGPRT